MNSMETLVCYYQNNKMFKIGFIIGFSFGFVIGSFALVATSIYCYKNSQA